MLERAAAIRFTAERGMCDTHVRARLACDKPTCVQLLLAKQQPVACCLPGNSGCAEDNACCLGCNSGEATKLVRSSQRHSQRSARPLH